MHALYELKEKLMDELEEYSKKPLSVGDLDTVDKLSHTIKNLCKIIEAAEEKYSEEGSYRGSSYEGGSYRGSSYAEDMRGERGTYSARRGRGRNARRDSMGRYSSDSQEMVTELRELMMDAPDERTRMEFQKFISKVEGMS